jgi:hypothetical protein
MNMGTLKAALDYANPDVIAKFRDKFSVSLEEALDIFSETKKWLWFAANSEVEGVSIHRAIQIIDEMWHTFITFTVDYAQYCESRFGRYLHHIPLTQEALRSAQRRFEADAQSNKDDRAKRLHAEFSEIQRLLGDETLITWLVIFREKYSPETCDALALSALKAREREVNPPISTDSSIIAQLMKASGDRLVDQLVDLAMIDSPQTTCEPGGGPTCGPGCLPTVHPRP